MSFGRRIRELRKSKEKSLRELAASVGIDFTYLSKVENDRLPPPAEETIRKIALELDANTDELLLLAKKVPSDLAEQLTESPDTVEMLRSMEGKVYTPEEWKELKRIAKEKGTRR